MYTQRGINTLGIRFHICVQTFQTKLCITCRDTI